MKSLKPLYLALVLSLSACKPQIESIVVLESDLTVLSDASRARGSFDPEAFLQLHTRTFKPGKVSFLLEQDGLISASGTKITLSQYQNGRKVSATLYAKGWSIQQMQGENVVIPARDTFLSENISIRRYDYFDRCILGQCEGESTYHIQFGSGAILSYQTPLLKVFNKNAASLSESIYENRSITPVQFDDESATYLPVNTSFSIEKNIVLSPRNSKLLQWQALAKGEASKDIRYFTQLYPNRPFCVLKSLNPVRSDLTLSGNLFFDSSKVVHEGNAIRIDLSSPDQKQSYSLTCTRGWKANALSGFQYTGVPSIYEIRQTLQGSMTLNR